jgi:hypothetical protein
MDVKLYTGTSNTGTVTVSGLAFSPDLVWVKNRTNLNRHGLADTIRGVNNSLASNRTDGELTTRTDLLTSFNSDGFTVGGDAGQYGWNYPSASFAAWCWDAGSSTVTNNDGTITSQVRANTSAGFSVIGWTGASSGTASIGHGLGVAPAMVITRPRNATSNWVVYHRSAGNDAFLRLNTTDASVSSSACFGTGPTSTVFTLDQGSLFAIAGNCIGYAFAPVEGYSAFGSYVGSTSFPFVYCGFQPRFLLIKPTNLASDWYIYDSARNPYNVSLNRLLPNSSSNEASAAGNEIDLLSNGFRVLGASNSGTNYSGINFIYAAFAESPFSLARAR